MTMKIAPTNVLFIPVLALCSLSLLAGCEDQQAKQAHDEAEQIVNARVEYLNAVTAEDKVSGLQAFASGLPNAATIPASGLMNASANLEIAELKLLEARRLEDENSTLRNVVDGVAAAAMKLSALAEAHEGFDDQPVYAVISESTRDADAGLGALKETITDLEEPIGTLETLNSGNRADVAKLRVESRQLREQAFDAGQVGGHQLMEFAVTTDKRADAIEAEMAQREIELIGLRSELRLAQLQHDLLSKQKAAMSQASGEVSRTIDQFQSIARDVRNTLGEYGTEVDQALQAISLNMETLEDLYTDAANAATTASQSGSTAGGRDRQAANAVTARAYQTLGRSHAQQATGLRNHASLLSRIVKSNVGTSQHASDAQALATAANNAQTAAAEAFQEAMKTLESAGNNTDVAMLRQLLNQAATGKPVDFSTLNNEDVGSVSGSTGGDFSPEATLAFLQQVDSRNFGEVIAAMNIYHATTPADQEILDATRDLTIALQEFDRALKGRFGTGLMEIAESQMSGLSNMAAFTNLRITQKRELEADFAYTTPTGQPATGKLVKVNNTWYVDFGALIRGTPGYEASQNAIMLQMFDTMSAAARSVSDRIGTGDFSSAQEAMAAFIQQMGFGSGG